MYIRKSGIWQCLASYIKQRIFFTILQWNFFILEKCMLEILKAKDEQKDRQIDRRIERSRQKQRE